jgi:hypothetical protein
MILSVVMRDLQCTDERSLTADARIGKPQAASASLLVGVVYDAMAVPMAGLIATCGVLEVLACRLPVANRAQARLRIDPPTG